MYYIVQENLFSERNYGKIYKTLDRLELPYEIVKIMPFVDSFEFESDRKDIFVFGGTKMARLAKQYKWSPGSRLNDNHDYEVYSKYYKENLLNFDSKIIRLGDDLEWKNEHYFVRPCADNKLFTGGVFDKQDWLALKERLLRNEKSPDDMIQFATPKMIQKEFRFFVVGGKIITGSQYTLHGRYSTSPIIDKPAQEFAQKMVNLYSLNDSFVIDIAQTPIGYKIVECGCINCAGFYDSDVMKLLIALEEYYN